MAQFETWLKTDLKKPVTVQALRGVMFSADSAGNRIGVEVFDGGQAAALNGEIMGYAIRADGATLTIPGTISGNKAAIVLPALAYAVVGSLDIVIKNVVNGESTATLAACRAYVQRSATDTIVDPGHVIPSLEELLAQIAVIEAAVEAADTAANNANTKAALADAAASNANAKAALAEAAAEEIDSLTVAASTGNPGTNAQAVISEIGGHKHIAFTIPRGNKGDKGDKGDTGDDAAITTTDTVYQNSTSGSTIPTGTWLDTRPTTPHGQFLWTRTTLTWNNGQTTILYSAAYMGIDGSGTVSSVNGVSPDQNGNVVIPTGTVNSVNGISPDEQGNITIPIDSVPSSGSNNPITSGGVYSALSQNASMVNGTVTYRNLDVFKTNLVRINKMVCFNCVLTGPTFADNTFTSILTIPDGFRPKNQVFFSGLSSRSDGHSITGRFSGVINPDGTGSIQTATLADGVKVIALNLVWATT